MAEALYALSVYRVLPNISIHALMLSEEVKGVMTHWKKRSYVCQGDRCPAFLHSDPSPVWKGYLAAQVWHGSRKKWCPVVLEVTEHLELDLRGLYRRGQVWEIFRALGTKAKTSPLEGKLIEERDQATCSPAFDILPTLRALYHVADISLNCGNPMPPRTLVSDSEGDAPKGIKTEEAPACTPEEYERLKREFNNRKKSPVTSNGRH